MVESAILDVCRFLKGKNITIPSNNQWLRGSIECFTEGNRNCLPNQLKEFVFTQWKLADLRDVAAPTLPLACKTSAKTTLQGKHAVQINYVINVGESCYKQLQKIRRPTAEDNLSVDTEVDKANTEISANRTLKLEITDGLVTLLGFEDKQIRKLVEPFVPGVKAVLTGPIECRNGVMFLKNENIDVVGGEVDTLHVPNASENLLARALKQPENPDPYKSLDSEGLDNNQEVNLLDIPQDDEAFLQIPDDFGEIQTSTAPSSTFSNDSSSRNFSSSASSRTGIESRNENTFSRQNSIDHSSRNKFNGRTDFTSTTTVDNETPTLDRSINNSFIELDDDDEFALIAAETASAAEKSAKSSKPLNPKQSNLHNFFSKNSKSSESSKACSSDRHTNADSGEGGVNKIKSSTRLNEMDLRAQLEESYSDFMTSDQSKNDTYTSIFKKEPSKTKKSNQESKETLHQDKNSHKTPVFPPTKYPSVLTVHATVQSITQKLCIQENNWNLTAVVKIQSVEIEVDFSPQLLDNILGMTAVEIQSKRKECKQNAQLKEKLNEVLKISQKRLKSLDCDIKIHFASYIAKPLVLEIFD